MAFPAGRGVVLIKEESTPGTPESLSASDVHYVEDWSGHLSPTMTPRNGMSPFRPGWKPVMTDSQNSFSGRVELGTFGVAATDADRPTIEPFLRMGGFNAGTFSAAGNPNTLIYTLIDQNHATVTLREIHFEEGGSDGKGWEWVGARADWTLEFPPDGRCMFQFTGEGKGGIGGATGGADTGSTQLTSSLTAGTYDYEMPAPIVGSMWQLTLTELNGDSTFSGDVVSGTMTANMGLQRQMGMHGGVGPANIRLVPSAAMVFDLVVEQVVDGTWDPETIMGLPTKAADFSGTQTANGMSFSLAATIGSDTVTIAFHGALSGMELIGDQNGRRLWRLSHSGMYPEVSTDGGGLRPANNLTITYSTPD